MKRVLILMSVFDGQQYIREQIDSLLSQKGVIVHILIRDDGSPKRESIEIISKYIASGAPITLVCGCNLGFALSFSALIKEAYEKFEDFDYYAFSDQDDVWLEDKLLSAVKKLDTVNGQVSDKPISYCSATTLVDNNLVPLKRKSKKYTKFSITKSNCLLQSCATGCTMLFNKKALYLYATHMPSELYAHDMMMYQMCVYLGQVVYDTNSYILYRQHGNNQIGSNNAIGRMKNRLEYNKHAGTLQLQAQRLLELYKDQMTLIDIAIVSKLAFYKDNLFTKLSLLFDSKYRYKSMESNFFYFLKIILGGV